MKHIENFNGFLNESQDNLFEGKLYDDMPGLENFVNLFKKVKLDEIMQIWKDPSKAPSFSGLSVDERLTLIAMALLIGKGYEIEKDEKAINNYVQWLINIKNAPFAVRGMVAMQEMFPDIRDNDYWETDMKNKFFDEGYPELHDDGEKETMRKYGRSL